MKLAAFGGLTAGWGMALLAWAAALSLLAASGGCGGQLSPRATCSEGEVTTAGGCSSETDCGACSPLRGSLPCAIPVFAPQAGTVASGTGVVLTAASLPANGFIYYTTDQTMPTHASKFVAPGDAVTVLQSETIAAIAYAMGSCSDSAVATATYDVVDAMDANFFEPVPCDAPTFMPAGGSLPMGSAVTIVPPANFPASFPQGSATIYYTVDGTIPTHASPAYSGPIQLNTVGETIRAIAYDPGVCSDSTVAVAGFTLPPPCAPPELCEGSMPPIFNPPATTQANDFLVQLTSFDPGATICFTFGTVAPTCTSTVTSATCSGTSQTYDESAGLGARGSVTINGDVTSAAGTVAVNAIACAPGSATSFSALQIYTLQAAAPTMHGPAPSQTLPYQAGGYMPTLSSLTAGATLNYTTDGTTPTCAADILDAGTLDAGNLDTVPTIANATYNAVACKPGYAPSKVPTFTYGIVLPPPGFVDSVSTTTPEGTGTYDGALSIDFSGPPIPMGGSQPSGLFVCYTSDGTAPTCGTTARMCAQGTSDNVVGSMPTAVSITASGTSVNAVACSPSYNESDVATATYKLQLDAATDATTE